MKTLALRILACALLGISTGASAVAVITVVNTDGPGEGFNDPTPITPTFSNPATTVGAARLFVFQAAANQWAQKLDSNVEIKVRAAFNPLTCSGTSAVLGSAGATSVARDFPNAPLPGRSYSIALANSLAGTDLNGTGVGQEEINSQFNTSIDNGTCLTGTLGWSYVTVSSDPVPAGRIPLLPVVFHELGHGLGFQTFVNQSGALFNGFPDQWTQFLSVGGTQSWDSLDNAGRAASAIGDPNLVWTGPNVDAQKTRFLGKPPALVINTPAPIAGLYPAQTAAFGPLPSPPAGVTGDVVLGVDGTAGGTINDGCEPLINGAAVAGKIALLERGLCNFTVKVKNAQDVGAIAVLVMNNVADGLPGMGGTDNTVTIPSYGISQAVGNSIRAQPLVNASLAFDQAAPLAGTTNGFTRMHAPNPFEPGSSVSHFTLAAFPNLLMEPSLSTAFSEVDLTLPLFRDIGWQVGYIFSDSLE